MAALTATSALAIVDPGTSGLTSGQLADIQASGQTTIGYLSIGEAEDWRAYSQPSWAATPPSWLLGQDPAWPGNYEVEFWDPAWQAIVLSRAVHIAQEGYGGLLLDVVDAYNDPAVIAAYHGTSDPRTEMMNFVEEISAATKAVNPNFQILQNNAEDLLVTNPGQTASATNTAYLSHIDGVTSESTFFNADGTPTSWASTDVQYLEHAVADGKSVYDIEYPTSPVVQQTAAADDLGAGFTPLVDNPASGQISVRTIAASSESTLAGSSANDVLDGTVSNDSIAGLGGNDTLAGAAGDDTVNGNQGNDLIHGGQGDDVLYGGQGNDTLFGDLGNNTLAGGAGADLLTGGQLTGSEGNNVFLYSAMTDSTASAPDLITDFKPGMDHIDLSALHTSFPALEILHTVTNSGALTTVGIQNTSFQVDLAGDVSLFSTDFVF